MDETPAIDSSLIQRAKRGSSPALRRLLYEAGMRWESHIALKIPKEFRSLIAAEDIIQIARTRALQQIRQLESDCPNVFLAWFRRIAENALQSEIRALNAVKRGGGRKRVQEDSSKFKMADLSAETPSPRHKAELQEIVLAVKSNIDCLPTTQRNAVRLHHLDSYSIAETAEIMGKPKGAVRGLIAAAKKTLKSALGNSTKWFSR